MIIPTHNKEGASLQALECLRTATALRSEEWPRIITRRHRPGSCMSGALYRDYEKLVE
jgi:hypothetical protein